MNYLRYMYKSSAECDVKKGSYSEHIAIHLCICNFNILRNKNIIL